MTLNQMHKILSEEGVEKLEAMGKEFNPYEHHAMMQEESEEHEGHQAVELGSVPSLFLSSGRCFDESGTFLKI